MAILTNEFRMLEQEWIRLPDGKRKTAIQELYLKYVQEAGVGGFNTGALQRAFMETAPVLPATDAGAAEYDEIMEIQDSVHGQS